MIRKIYTLLILGLCLGFAACSDDNDGLDPNAAAPVIKFPMEQLDVDLNKVDNLPVVAVIKSQAGLQIESCYERNFTNCCYRCNGTSCHNIRPGRDYI